MLRVRQVGGVALGSLLQLQAELNAYIDALESRGRRPFEEGPEVRDPSDMSSYSVITVSGRGQICRSPRNFPSSVRFRLARGKQRGDRKSHRIVRLAWAGRCHTMFLPEKGQLPEE